MTTVVGLLSAIPKMGGVNNSLKLKKYLLLKYKNYLQGTGDAQLVRMHTNFAEDRILFPAVILVGS